jgi:hypothetical protein
MWLLEFGDGFAASENQDVIARSSALTLAACAALLLTACGGAGGTAAVPLPAASAAPAPATPHVNAAATATITIPPHTASAAARGAKAISPSTQGIVIDGMRSDGYQVNSFTPVTLNSNGCVTRPADGYVTCTITFAAPVTTGGQTDTLTVQLLDSTVQANGNLLDTATMTGATITLGATNTFQFVVGGVEGRQPCLGSSTTSKCGGESLNIPIPGNGGTVSFYPIATDWDGNPISGKLDSPMVLTLSSVNGYWDMGNLSGPGYTVTSVVNTFDTLTITDLSLFTGPATVYDEYDATLTVASSGAASHAYAIGSAYGYNESGANAQLQTVYTFVPQGGV